MVKVAAIPVQTGAYRRKVIPRG